MIIKEKPIETIVIHTDQPFEQIKTVRNQERCGKISRIKRVIFTRYIGIPEDEEHYMINLSQLDREMNSLSVGYLCLEERLHNNFSQSDIKDAEKIWSDYLELESKGINDLTQLYRLEMGYTLKDTTLEMTKKILFKEMINTYDQNNKVKGLSAKKNFAIKFLIWMNHYIKQLFTDHLQSDHIPKVIYYGDIKQHEQYFLLFLSKMGSDVIYINPKEDMKNLLPQIKTRSVYSRQSNTTQTIMKIPRNENIGKRVYANEKQINDKEAVSKQFPVKYVAEKSYEELAQLAKSVILINVYDSNKELVSSGSGVLISKNGIILTNFHVINSGVIFGIFFENNENEYLTSKIIKYHQNYDLALLKIDRETDPLLMNSNEKLERGQKIVAIGSPLGLFNTISDGIISGFRNMRDTELLQITAPISPGSSGGALLDMYGNLIGITTAGLEGQNLNLAVGTKYIKLFANEIIESL